MAATNESREGAGQRRRAVTVSALAVAFGALAGLIMTKLHWVAPLSVLELLLAVGWTAFAWIRWNGSRPPHPLAALLHLMIAISMVAAITPLPRAAFGGTVTLSVGLFIAYSAKQPRLTRLLILALGAILVWTQTEILLSEAQTPFFRQPAAPDE